MRFPSALAVGLALMGCEEKPSASDRAIHDKVAALTAQIEKSQSAQATELTDKVAALTAQLEKSQSVQATELADQVSQLTAQVAKIEKSQSTQATELADKVAALTAQLEKSQSAQVTELADSVNQLAAQVAKVEKELAEVKELAALPEFEKMRRNSQKMTEQFRPKPVNLDTVATITLPENPTRSQVQDYVRSVLGAYSGNVVPSSNEPQVDLLLKVGPEHLEVLLEQYAASASRYGTGSPHLLRAIESLASGEKHKQLILDRLFAQPNLIGVVEKMGWMSEAKPILLKGLSEKPSSLPSQWITHIANLRDPTTYEALKEAMVNSSQPATIYHAIKDLAGIDLDDAVQRAWKRIGNQDSPTKAGFATIAIAHGDKDALGAFIDIIDVTDHFELHRKGWAFLDRSVSPRKVVLKHIDFQGTNEEIVVWFEKNYHKLKFDKTRKLFVR